MVYVEFRKAIVVAFTAIVGSAFIFGDFAKKLVDNFAFIFILHPFDVGDWCLIEDAPVRYIYTYIHTHIYIYTHTYLYIYVRCFMLLINFVRERVH